MKRGTKYVAFDVHQDTIVTSVREESGKVILRGTIPTEATDVLELLGMIRGSVRVVFEEGTQAHWLYHLIRDVVDQVIVCDRRGERRSRGNKADQADADMLSDRLRRGELRPVYHGTRELDTLVELVRAYANVVEDSTRVKLRLKAIFRARGKKARGGRIYGLENAQEYLGKLDEHGARVRASALYLQVGQLTQLRRQLKQAMIAESRLHRGYYVLRSIPNLGPVRAAVLLATMKTPHRFRTKRNLWAYVGLAVVTESSGQHEFDEMGRLVQRRRRPLTRGLNRNHNARLKNVFMSMSIDAIRREGPFRHMYERMVHDQGMREQMARLTIARKCAAVVLTTWKRGEPYDPAKVTAQPVELRQ